MHRPSVGQPPVEGMLSSLGESGSSRPNVVPYGNPLSLTLNLAFTPNHLFKDCVLGPPYCLAKVGVEIMRAL